MEKILLNVLQMSIYGSIATVAVLILRKCFVKLPKRITCLFWIVPVVRLLCPVNFGMAFSLLNIAGAGRNTSGRSIAGPAFNAVLAEPSPLSSHSGGAVSVAATGAAAFDWKMAAFGIWIFGIVSILVYLSVKTVRMYSMLKGARRPAGRDYYVSDIIDTSFVLGLIRPRVYMQSGLSSQEEAYIYMHELTHIKNGDHITRFIGVLTVCLHWFNPIVWLGFIRMCSDLEMRCDEAVIDSMGEQIKKDYCMSIVEHAAERESVHSGLYAAFAGDNHNGREIKMRVNNLIKYKKVSKILAAVVIIFAIGTVTILSSKAAEGKNKTKETEAMDTQAAADITEDTAPAMSDVSTDDACVEEHVGMPVGDPNVTDLNLTEEESLLNYGFNGMVIPDDVEYSDEGRPFSKSYDFRTDPTLKKLAEIFEKNGYEVQAYDIDYLDKDGNIKTGKELYHFSACIGEYDVVNVSLCSKEYGEGHFNEYEEEDGLWYIELDDDNWKIYRIYDPQTGVLLDAEGNGVFDWRSMGIFDAIR